MGVINFEIMKCTRETYFERAQFLIDPMPNIDSKLLHHNRVRIVLINIVVFRMTKPKNLKALQMKTLIWCSKFNDRK